MACEQACLMASQAFRHSREHLFPLLGSRLRCQHLLAKRLQAGKAEEGFDEILVLGDIRMLYPGSVPQAFWRVPRVEGRTTVLAAVLGPLCTPKLCTGRTPTDGFEAVPSKLLHTFLDEFACLLVFSSSA